MDIRIHVHNMFSAHLESAIAKKLEISVYNFTIRKSNAQHVQCSWNNKAFKMFYSNKARSLSYNLKHCLNLASKINNKIYKVQDVPYMLPWELWPEKYEAHFQKILTKEMINLKDSIDETNESGLFVCGKCKSDCTTYFSIQTRSADEPMTNYITCKKCRHNWKD